MILHDKSNSKKFSNTSNYFIVRRMHKYIYLIFFPNVYHQIETVWSTCISHYKSRKQFCWRDQDYVLFLIHSISSINKYEFFQLKSFKYLDEIQKQNLGHLNCIRNANLSHGRFGYNHINFEAKGITRIKPVSTW